jgi:hypothetical protein
MNIRFTSDHLRIPKTQIAARGAASDPIPFKAHFRSMRMLSA